MVRVPSGIRARTGQVAVLVEFAAGTGAITTAAWAASRQFSSSVSGSGVPLPP